MINEDKTVAFSVLTTGHILVTGWNPETKETTPLPYEGAAPYAVSSDSLEEVYMDVTANPRDEWDVLNVSLVGWLSGHVVFRVTEVIG